MPTEISRRAAVTLAAVAIAGARATAADKPMTMKVTMNGAQEVPPVDSKGTGTANLTYNPSDMMLTWDVTYSGLSSEATMAHFHGPAPAGKNANVQVWISKKGGAVTSPIKGSEKLTPDQAKMLTDGQLYVNVHTKDHPAGEIRGQVAPPKSA